MFTKRRLNLSFVGLFLLASLFTPKNLSAQQEFQFVEQKFDLAEDVLVAGNTLYATATDTGVDILHSIYSFDISDPYSLSPMGRYASDTCSFYHLNYGFPHYLYASQHDRFCEEENSLYLFNAINPASLKLMGIEEIGGPGASMELDSTSSYVYVTNAHGGMAIVDIKDPYEPALVNTFKLEGSDFRDVQVVGDYALLAELNGSFVILDISNPIEPKLVSNLAIPLGNVLGVEVVGDLAYLATGSEGVTVVDISDLSLPFVQGAIDTVSDGSYARDVVAYENYLFVANDQAGIFAVDISDSNNLVALAEYDTGRAAQVDYANGFLYVADWEQGVVVLRFNDMQEEPEPQGFLRLPWDYERHGLSFDEAALSINAYFDHQYPLLSVGNVLSEPATVSGDLVEYNFNGVPNLNKFYSSHDGYDYGRKAKAILGESVLAAADGTATYRWGNAGGNTILIDHGNGYQTRYMHLQGEGLVVGEGQSVAVTKGQQIGLIGSTGNRSSGPHIHFMVVQDKNDDGNFDDNIPDGVLDPFGWQGKGEDPWPQHSFEYAEQMRTGNVSWYMWDKLLASQEAEKPIAVEYETQVSKFGIYFRAESFDLNVDLDIDLSPSYSSRDLNLYSLGSTLSIIASSGNQIISELNDSFSLTIDFSQFDLSAYDEDSLLIYSSEDGINWDPEPTSIDWFGKEAKTSIDHLSYFALMASLKETDPPVTSFVITGTQISLQVSDESEIYYTGYKIDDGTWRQYLGPVELTEGKHVIEFYSEDVLGNLEEVKSETVEISAVEPETPELVIYFDEQNNISYKPEDPDDSLQTFSEKAVERIVVADDVSENTLELTIDKKDSRLRILSLDYGFQRYDLPHNQLLSRAVFWRGGLKLLRQSWYQKGGDYVKLNYLSYNDISKASVKSEKGWSKYEYSDLHKLMLRTKGGEVVWEIE